MRAAGCLVVFLAGSALGAGQARLADAGIFDGREARRGARVPDAGPADGGAARAPETPQLDGEASAAKAPCEGATVTLHAFIDLPRSDARSHNLSGLAWDEPSQTLRAVSDKDPWLVALKFSADWKRVEFGQTLEVTNAPWGRWDAEAVARRGDGWLLSDEAGPNLLVVEKDGRVSGTLPEPKRMSRARFNLGIEGLALLKGGKTLLLAVEQPLEGDGERASSTLGVTVRVFRRTEGQPDVELAYRTDPAFGDPGDVGVTELAAVDDTTLLVLERAWTKGKGNRVRLYCTRPTGPDVSGVDHLGLETPALPKRLLVDLGTLPDTGVPTPPGAQEHRLLDNYEGLAVGPRLADGRRLLFLVSDDNSARDQVARVLVLAVDGL